MTTTTTTTTTTDGRQPIKLRHDWYQTDAHVVVSLMTKNIRAEDKIDVKIDDNSVDFSVKSVDVEVGLVHLNLAHSVSPALSAWKRFPSKIEIKLAKTIGVSWKTLEKHDPASNTATIITTSTSSSSGHEQPSRSHNRDWDKIMAEIGRSETEEKVDGEAGVNKLFQDLYEGGSEEVRRAMNKSFMESGGTVLSTNWNDVGKEQVQMKPPEGMEFKKWDE